MQVQHRNAVNDGEDAAMAAEDAVLQVIVASRMEERVDERQPATAVGTTEEV